MFPLLTAQRLRTTELGESFGKAYYVRSVYVNRPKQENTFRLECYMSVKLFIHSHTGKTRGHKKTLYKN